MTWLSTFQECYQEVLDHGFGSTRYLQFAKDKVNEGQHEICRRVDMRATQVNASNAIASGASSFNLPSDYARLRFIHNSTTDKPLFPYGSVDELLGEVAQAGEPRLYVVEAGAVQLYPTSNASYTLLLYYNKLPATLTADADIPIIPQSYRKLMVDYAVAQAYKREQDYEAMREHMALFDNGLLRMAADLQHDARSAAQPSQVAGPWV